MIYKKPKGSLIAALDIGSLKTSCFIARVADDHGGFEVLGVGHHASQAMKAGAITNLDQVENVVRNTVHAAENMAADFTKGYPLREVVVNIAGVHTRSYIQAAHVQIAGHEIIDQDIVRALSRAQQSVVDDGHEIIHTIPAAYRVDGHDGIKEPRGMYAQQMEMDVHLVTGEVSALKNIATCTGRSHLDIAAFCADAYAAGLASLVDDEMDLGCVLINIGGGVTSFAVFHSGNLIHHDAIPVGGHHVTSDIAKGLTTTMQDAERLKVLYGNAMALNTDEREMIDVPPLGEEQRQGPNHVPRSVLVGIMQPRLEEIFELVRARLKDSGLAPVLGRRVVLTGGSSQIPGIKDLAAHVLDKQVRLGRPIRVGGLPDAVAGPAFATTAGLLSYASTRGREMPANILTQIEGQGLFERVKVWLRDNW